MRVCGKRKQIQTKKQMNALLDGNISITRKKSKGLENMQQPNRKQINSNNTNQQEPAKQCNKKEHPVKDNYKRKLKIEQI